MEAEDLDVYAVLNSLSEGVIIADLSGRIFFSNRATDRLLGVTEAEGLPEKWADYEGVFLPDSTVPCACVDQEADAFMEHAIPEQHL